MQRTKWNMKTGLGLAMSALLVWGAASGQCLAQGPGMEPEVQFFGRINHIDPDSGVLRVNGVTVETTTHTVYLNLHHEALTFADLAVGQFVKVKGAHVGHRTILADEIVVETDAGGGGVGFHLAFRGVIDSVDPTSRTLTVNGHLVRTNDRTRIVDTRRHTIAFEDLEAGQTVMVMGRRLLDHSVLAVMIRQLPDGPPADVEIEIKGLIESIDPTSQTLQVRGRRVLTDDSTVYLDIFGDEIGFEELAPGQLVEVRGLRLPEGRILARQIILEEHIWDPGLRPHVLLRGHIEALDPTSRTLTVRGHTLETNPSSSLAPTRYFNERGEPITYEDLMVDQFVRVRAVLMPDDRLVARFVRRAIPPGGLPGWFDTIVHGTISDIDPTSRTLVVRGFTIGTSGRTFYRGRFGRILAFEDLAIGDYVRVKGLAQPDHSILAGLVRRFDQHFEFAGQGHPVLGPIGENGPGVIRLGWDNLNLPPGQFLALAYDVYRRDWAPHEPTQSIWHPFPAGAGSGTIPVGHTGGYFVWIFNQYHDGELNASQNPAGIIVAGGPPHMLLDCLAEDLGGGEVELTWRPNLFGSWVVWIAVFDVDLEEWVELEGPLGRSLWQYVLWDSEEFQTGAAPVTPPGPGRYLFFLSCMGWDGSSLGEWAMPFVDVSP